MIPILFGITLITFIIINAAGSPLQNMEFNPRVKPEDIERIRNNLGLNEPVWKRYFIWVGNVLQGDLGLSLINFRPVTDRIREVMFNTLLLSFLSITISLVDRRSIGHLRGDASKRHRRPGYQCAFGSRLCDSDRLARPAAHYSLFGAVRKMGIPVAAGGRRARLARRRRIKDRIEHLILPMTALVIPQVGIWLFWVRSNMLEVLGQDYMRAARARGLREKIRAVRPRACAMPSFRW